MKKIVDWFRINWAPTIILPCVITVSWLLGDAMYKAATNGAISWSSVRIYTLVTQIFTVTGLFFMGMEHAENLRKKRGG
jgi:hypothetical protein